MPDVEPSQKTLLILSQVFVPDPAAVGQYMSDVADEMGRRGHRIVVLTSNRGYENPRIRFPARESMGNMDVVRLPLSSFGKSSIVLRVLAGMFFVVQCAIRGLLVPRLSCILVSTSPPICIVAALLIRSIRRTPVKFWVMDLNPDQMVALGKIKPTSPFAMLMDWLNRLILTRSSDVIVLDRFMRERVIQKLDVSRKMHVIPPWSLECQLESVPHEANAFRTRHRLAEKFVLMYSGNMSVCSPLTTLLQAAFRLKEDTDLRFVFVGGGLGRAEIDEMVNVRQPGNVLALPYQPLSEIKYSLSAADVHIVALGSAMSGIIHPSKVYGALAVGRPILFLGPRPSFVSDILERHHVGWQVMHGDVEGVIETVRAIRRMRKENLAEMGVTARRVALQAFGRKDLCGRFCDILERGTGGHHFLN